MRERVRKWLKRSGVGTLFIELGSSRENGYVESFPGKLRDECLDGELLLSLAEARYVVHRWRVDYNHHRLHSRLNWMTPAAFSARRRGLRRRSCCTYAPTSPCRNDRMPVQTSPGTGQSQ